jgi:hypothetical protein
MRRALLSDDILYTGNDFAYQERLSLHLVYALNLQTGDTALQEVGKLACVEFGTNHVFVA